MRNTTRSSNADFVKESKSRGVDVWDLQLRMFARFRALRSDHGWER